MREADRGARTNAVTGRIQAFRQQVLAPDGSEQLIDQQAGHLVDLIAAGPPNPLRPRDISRLQDTINKLERFFHLTIMQRTRGLIGSETEEIEELKDILWKRSYDKAPGVEADEARTRQRHPKPEHPPESTYPF